MGWIFDPCKCDQPVLLNSGLCKICGKGIELENLDKAMKKPSKTS